MRITIDSTDALDDALRVLGGLYGVTLSVASASDTVDAQPAESGEPAAEQPAAAPVRPRRSRGQGAQRSTTPDLAAVRSWAREHGYQVSDRGRVSNAVLDAYRNDTATG